jgi:hypothetical protein
VPLAQAAPQPPQLRSSSFGSEHLPSQSTSPVEHDGPGTGGVPLQDKISSAAAQAEARQNM